ncbi:MAG TPA: tetratricopeptide repeat protein [Kofleriaceae bacterium]|nr:tetratricopeptide repeat protein [Kofleriaceae bacterium]
MTRSLAIRLGAVLLAGALAACGGKNKSDAAQPGGGGGGAGGGDAVAGGADGAGGGDGAGGLDGAGGGDGGGADGTGGGAPGEPDIKPPGLDLPPAEKARRVAEHVKKGLDALEKSNNPDLAVTEAKAALAVDETAVDAMVLLAHAYYVKGFHDLVEDVLGKAVQRGGAKNKKLHFLMGLVHDKSKRPDQAMDAYAKAVALDSNYRPALMNLGVHLLQNKRFQEAVNLYERLTGQLGYRTAASMSNLGSAYRGWSAEFTTSNVQRRNQLLLKAEAAYKKSIDIDKNYANAYYNLGLLYLDADPFPKGSDDMDLLERLQKAKGFFNDYRRMPGANQKLADEQVAVTQKLIDKEERARKKAAEREARRKEREAKDKASGGK